MIIFFTSLIVVWLSLGVLLSRDMRLSFYWSIVFILILPFILIAVSALYIKLKIDERKK
jgi:membrane protein DedA with SNARE-associated domain